MVSSRWSSLPSSLHAPTPGARGRAPRGRRARKYRSSGDRLISIPFLIGVPHSHQRTAHIIWSSPIRRSKNVSHTLAGPGVITVWFTYCRDYEKLMFEASFATRLQSCTPQPRTDADERGSEIPGTAVSLPIAEARRLLACEIATHGVVVKRARERGDS